MINIISNIISRASDNRSSLSPLGIINSETTWSNLNDYTVNGSTFSVSGGKLVLTGGIASFADRLLFSKSTSPFKYTCLEKWKMRVKLITPSTINGAATYGIGIGIDSVYGISDSNDFSNIIRWVWDTSNNGQLVRYVQKGFTNQLFSGAALVPAANTTYIIELERNKTALTYTIFDNAGVQLFTYTFTFDLGSNNYIQSHNTGRFGLWNFGGTNIQITELTISSTANKGVNYITIGDSNMSGLWATTTGSRYIEQAMSTKGKSYEILAGIGDRTADALLRVGEMIALNPKNAFINLISNDIANSVSSVTWQANFNSIVSRLQGAGINVKVGSPIARTSADMTPAATFTASLGLPYIDQFGLTKNVGDTHLQNAYGGAVDGIHQNLAGNNANATLLTTIL